MRIFGAGMAGLLAGHYFRRFSPVICEAQQSLPNNHAALLRFRSDAVAKAVNIPFKKVCVHKLIAHAGKIHTKPTLKLNNMYSQKVTGKVMERSIGNLDPVDRYIAPNNFIELLAKGLDLRFCAALDESDLASQESWLRNGLGRPLISTIPMDRLMDMVQWKDKPEFKYKPIISVWAKIKSPQMDVYNTVYYPDFTDDYYRISITGDVVIAEFLGDCENAAEYLNQNEHNIEGLLLELSTCLAREFGIYEVEFEEFHIKNQKYGKLLPIDEQMRREFILFMTDKFQIYSVGRFATWRQLLMDDVVQDLGVIEKLIDQRNGYGQRLKGLT